METFLLTGTVTIAAAHGLGFAKVILSRQGFTPLSLYDSSSDQPSPSGILQISAVIVPVDTVATPPVKSSIKTAPRKLARKMRRTRRRSLAGGGGGAQYGEDGGFFGDAGDGDGPFGGGGGGWNSDRFGGFNWDDSSSASSPHSAFYVVYETICWIAFSNCLHFALKKVVRIVGDGTGRRLQ